ncbi:hypothetical protein GCM10010302_10390 [Streptomyces polychromogenes]|uniref:Uncharacterized protein n=1 Tax=Streptomyces polychromogenes TaxID=67342 RepID=A0ABP3ERC5_9ACTN
MAEQRKVSGRQRGWAVAGALAAWGAVAGWLARGTEPDGVFVAFVVTAVAATVPLLLQDGPRTFARACLVSGLVLLVWGPLGASIGAFWFTPAAFLLLVAAFVDAGNRPGAWFSVIAPFAAVVVTALCLAPAHDSPSENEPPPSLHAALDSASRVRDQDLGPGLERLRDFGAVGVETVETEPGRPVLVVKMPRHFTGGQSQERLREEVLRLPGVLDVRVCTFHTC